MNVEYTVNEQYYLTTSERKVNHRRGWYVGRISEPDQDVFYAEITLT